MNQNKESNFRAFIAIELPIKVKKEIAKFIDAMKEDGVQAHWAEAEKLHITLKFLGNISQQQCDQIIDLIKPIIRKHKRFNIEFNQLLYLPSKKSPQVLSLAATPISPLAALAIEIETALTTLEFKPEKRAYKPHLTIGRIKTSKFHFPKTEPKLQIKLKPKEVILFKSELNRAGSIYTPVKAFSLG